MNEGDRLHVRCFWILLDVICLFRGGLINTYLHARPVVPVLLDTIN